MDSKDVHDPEDMSWFSKYQLDNNEGEDQDLNASLPYEDLNASLELETKEDREDNDR